MSAVPDQSGLLPAPPLPLGQLLLERGLLSQVQLSTALAEQARSGAPLGEVIVELGYLPAALIAQALATQHGGLLKTEYGFATGFTDGAPPAAVEAPLVSAPQPAPEAVPEPALAPVPLRVASEEVPPAPQPVPLAEAPAPEPVAPAAPEVEVIVWEPVAGEAEPAPAPVAEVAAVPSPDAAVAARLAEVEADLMTARGELEALRLRAEEVARERDDERDAAEAAVRRIEALEQELATAVAAGADTSGLDEAVARAEELQTRLGELEARLETAAGQASAIEAERDELASANDQLASALAERTRRCEELEAELERVGEPAVAAEVEAPVAAHLAFVAGPDGYSMVERPGPLPGVGTIVDLPEESGAGGRHLVVRTGAANLPGVKARCAYLLPVD